MPDESAADSIDRLLRHLADTQANTASGPTPLRVGIAWDPGFLYAPVHMIDGDGASLCETVSAGDLVEMTHQVWSQIERVRRCATCHFLLSLDKGDGK
jgi:hypothetical protein